MSDNLLSLDYNVAGVNYAMMAQKIRSMPQGGMTDSARDYYLSVLRVVAKLDRNKNQDNSIINDACGCTHHFEAFLYQMLAFLSHIEAIDKIKNGQISPSYPVTIITEESNKENLFPPLLIGVSARNIEFDFMILLLISVALLERLSVFASNLLLGSECNFYNLRKNLAQSKDARATKIIACLDIALPSISNILITGSAKSLRNRLAHLSSVPELLNSVLTIHLLDHGKILVFDHDIAGYPVFCTARSINMAVPFIALNIISILISHDSNHELIVGTADIQNPPLSLFEPEWLNPAIDRRKYENTSGPQIAVTFLRPAPTLANVTLDKIELDLSVIQQIR